MSGLLMIVTDAGRAAIVNAENSGTDPLTIASVGVTATAFAASAATLAIPDEIKRLTAIAGGAVAADTIHMTIEDTSADTYSMRGMGAYLGDGTLFAVFSQADVLVEKSTQAALLLACDWQFADINAASLTFGDTSFLNPPATTDTKGVIELATNAEAIALLDAIRALTPANLGAVLAQWVATTAKVGGVELATDAETKALADNQRAVTPSNLGALLATTLQSGLVKLADATAAQALADASLALTPAMLKAALQGSNQSLSASGYQKLPGGLILQWGKTTLQGNMSITFPIAFPSALLCLTHALDSSTTRYDISQVNAAATLTGFGLTGSNTNTGQIINTALPVSWFAIGY